MFVTIDETKTVDELLKEIVPINCCDTERTPMIVENVLCDHIYKYYGHDHKNDYEKCGKCGHMREEE